jgi:hypothetical protein
VRRVPAIVLSSLLLSLAGFGAFGCGSEVTLRDPTGGGGAGGSTATTSSDATASASSGVTSTGSGGGVFCPGLVVGGESAMLVNDGFPTRIALTPGSGDGALSILAYAEGPSELRFIGFSPWNGWPEPLPGPYPSASLEGGESFAVWGAPGDRLGAVFRETTPDGSLLVVAPSVDVMAPGAAMRSPIPTAKRALAASVREAADGRQVLAVVEEESVSPDGLPLFVTRHVLSSPAAPLTLSEPDGCSNGPQWASAFPVDFGFRLVTLGAPSGGGCESTGYASALRAILLDSAGGTIALSYLDRGFPIADVAVAPTDTGAVIFHTAIMNALSPLWVIDWHEATGTFGEPVRAHCAVSRLRSHRRRHGRPRHGGGLWHPGSVDRRARRGRLHRLRGQSDDPPGPPRRGLRRPPRAARLPVWHVPHAGVLHGEGRGARDADRLHRRIVTAAAAAFATEPTPPSGTRFGTLWHTTRTRHPQASRGFIDAFTPRADGTAPALRGSRSSCDTPP